MKLLCVAVLTLVSAKVIKGPYRVTSEILSNPKADSSDRQIGIHYPKSEKHGQKFPFISYAHGLAAGGLVEPLAYDEIFAEMASFGYVIAAPRACILGCKDDHSSLPLDPPGFAHFYKQQLLTIDWAKDTLDAKLGGIINFSIGVGIAGHRYTS